MKKEDKLTTKIHRLFRMAGHPRYWHAMGPKKFETWVLCLGLVVKQVYRLSYRRAAKFLAEFYGISLHWTTLQKAARRLPKRLWQSLLEASLLNHAVELAAVDGTGFSRSSASHYFLRRIHRTNPDKRPLQFLAFVDVQHRKFLVGNLRAVPAGETKQVPGLHRQCRTPPDIVLMDKGFDAEWLHQWLNLHGTFSIVPARKNCRRGKHRKLMRDCFDYCLYWQRNIVEALFSAIKRLFGSHLASKHIKTQTAELFCRLIAYNVGYRLPDFFY